MSLFLEAFFIKNDFLSEKKKKSSLSIVCMGK